MTDTSRSTHAEKTQPALLVTNPADGRRWHIDTYWSDRAPQCQSIPPEDAHTWKLGSVERQDDLLTVPMAAKQMLGSTGIEACQQVLGVRDNVVVGTRSCNYIEEPADIVIKTPADPKRATNDAARMARTMVDKVKV
jgi:hypothetical protein